MGSSPNFLSVIILGCKAPCQQATLTAQYMPSCSIFSNHHLLRMYPPNPSCLLVQGLRGSIPPNFAYFHVEFGLSAGFVHVLDDEQSFDNAFGRNILIGLLGLPQEDMHRRAHEDDAAVLQRRAAQFAEAFTPYDWTQQLG